MAEIKTLIEALSAIQDNIEQPKKDASNPMFKSSYVTLDAVEDAILKAKKKAKVAVLINNETDDGYMYTVCEGYGDVRKYKGSRVADGLANRGTNVAQAEGSALTYARRYSLSMAFGITSDVDDDGQSVGKDQQHNKKPQRQQRPQQQATFQNRKGEMIAKIELMIKENNVDKATAKILVNDVTGKQINAINELKFLSEEELIKIGKRMKEGKTA